MDVDVVLLCTHTNIWDSENYFDEILVKMNIVKKLEKQLRSAKWNKEVENIGGVTDSYQSIKEKYKVMPEIVKLLITVKTSAIICTKSDLVLREYDLKDGFIVVATITTMDEAIREKLNQTE